MWPRWFHFRLTLCATAVGYERGLFFLSNFEDFVPFLSQSLLFHLFPHYFSQPKHVLLYLCAIKVRGRVTEWKAHGFYIRQAWVCIFLCQLASDYLCQVTYPPCENTEIISTSQSWYEMTRYLENILALLLTHNEFSIIIRHYCFVFMSCENTPANLDIIILSLIKEIQIGYRKRNT